MRASRKAHAAVLALLMMSTLGAAPPAPGVDAETIFENARKAWTQGAYPRYATYAAVVDFHNGPRHLRRTWDTIEDFRHETVFSHKFSREETANPPPPPRGINIDVPFFGTLNKDQPADPVGHVAFAVDQGYGIAPAQVHIESMTSASAFDAKRATPALIGRTGVVARSYDVQLLETVAGADGTAYHLALTPLRDPERYRLRELWVDARTWLPEAAVVAGIGNRPPLSTVRWRIEFRQVEGATYVARESALADVDFGAAGILHGLTVSFEELAPTSNPPAWQWSIGTSDDRPLSDP
jgi:hypothetical protein